VACAERNIFDWKQLLEQLGVDRKLPIRRLNKQKKGPGQNGKMLIMSVFRIKSGLFGGIIQVRIPARLPDPTWIRKPTEPVWKPFGSRLPNGEMIYLISPFVALFLAAFGRLDPFDPRLM
jgi:hypothetical protein